MELLILGLASGLALGLALGLWVRPQAPSMTVVVQEGSSRSEPWDQDEEGPLSPVDVEWMERLSESWRPVTEAERLFLEASYEEWSSREEE